jgi:hypothetical protein
VKQNPNELGKNANKETDPDPDPLCEMVTLALFLLFIFLVSKENVPQSNKEATKCCLDPSQTPKSKDKDHVRQIRFFYNED